MTTFTVTTAQDLVSSSDGKLSLREAVQQANATPAADTIQFAGALEGQTLVLSGGELVVRQDLSIDGDADNDGREVTVSGGDYAQYGGDGSRVLNIVGGGTDVGLRDLTMADGYDRESGGAVRLGGGSLQLTSCTVRASQVDMYGQGGGIYAASGSRVSIADSSIIGNAAGLGNIQNSRGGGIAAGDNVVLNIRNSLLADNFAGADTYQRRRSPA
jgi:hypothetical protein